jgi:hypothetical protein
VCVCVCASCVVGVCGCKRSHQACARLRSEGGSCLSRCVCVCVMCVGARLLCLSPARLPASLVHNFLVLTCSTLRLSRPLTLFDSRTCSALGLSLARLSVSHTLDSQPLTSLTPSRSPAL